MKFKKSIGLLVVCIVILSLGASLYGVFSRGGEGQYEFESIYGEKVEIYGKGLYRYDSTAIVAQGIAQDIVTLVIGIPLLILALYLSLKGSLKGRLLLTGTIGYFLYTYISYVFLWMYNPLFLVYVIIMSTSLFAFILSMMSFDVHHLKDRFNPRMPAGFLGGFQIFMAIALSMLWLGKIVPALIKGTVPQGLEHYTTLVIQGLDLGIIVPAALTSGILLLKRSPFGYLLSSVIIMKCITMGTAVTAMVIGQAMAGIAMGTGEIIMFPLFNLITVYCLVLLLKNIGEENTNTIQTYTKKT